MTTRPDAAAGQRAVAALTHPRRSEAIEAAVSFVTAMAEHQIACVVYPESREQIAAAVPNATLLSFDDAVPVELAVVFGGDGSILRAAEWALPLQVPVLGVNLGHVGFLAELEVSDLPQLATQVVNRDYAIEERVTVEVTLKHPTTKATVWSSFAVNEVSIEKMSRQKMIEVRAKVDGLPLSRWGCDGLLVATPTGSTAYAFSAGGPVVWPEVEAFVMVPLSAHALFARPLVLGPDSQVEVELLAGHAVVWCDGRRTADAMEGSLLQVRRSEIHLKLARLSVQPFTNRLVQKFDLPVDGWRRERD